METLRKFWKNPFARVCSGLCFVTFAFWVGVRTGFVPPPSEIARKIGTIPTPYLLAAFGLMTLQVWFQTIRFYFWMDQKFFPVRWRFAAHSLVWGQLLNLFLPARLGDVAKVLDLHKRAGLPYLEGSVILGIDKISDTLTMLPWVSFVSERPSKEGNHAGFPWMETGLIFTMLILFLLYRNPLARARMRDAFIRIRGTLASLLQRPYSSLGAIGFALASWGCEIWAVWFLIRGLMGEADYSQVAQAVVGANIGLSIPITPGGIGAFEAGVVGALSWGGMASDNAWVIAFSYHFVQWGGILVLAAFLPFLGRKRISA